MSAEHTNLIAKSIMDANLNGDEISRLFDVLREKRKIVVATQTAVTKASLTIGTRVSTFGLTPQYINGRTGKVVAIRGQKADLEMDNIIGGRRWGNSKNLSGVPISCLNILAAPTGAMIANQPPVKATGLVDFIER